MNQEHINPSHRRLRRHVGWAESDHRSHACGNTPPCSTPSGEAPPSRYYTSIICQSSTVKLLRRPSAWAHSVISYPVSRPQAPFGGCLPEIQTKPFSYRLFAGIGSVLSTQETAMPGQTGPQWGGERGLGFIQRRFDSGPLPNVFPRAKKSRLVGDSDRPATRENPHSQHIVALNARETELALKRAQSGITHPAACVQRAD